MSDLIDEVLRFDPLNEAEKITGKEYKDDKSTMALGLLLQMQHVKQADALMRATDDTAFSCDLSDYLRVAESIGFRTLLEVPLINKYDQHERYFIMWAKAGYLLSFDTFSHGDRANVNGGKFYYNLEIPEEDYEHRWHITSSGGWRKNADGTFTWAGDHDCREALRHKVNKLNPYVIPEWKHVPFLWLLHHADDHTRHKEITRERLALCGEVGQHILSLMVTA